MPDLTPAEHYREANLLIDHVTSNACDGSCPLWHERDAVAPAQVHATLALAPPDILAEAPDESRWDAQQRRQLGALGASRPGWRNGKRP